MKIASIKGKIEALEAKLEQLIGSEENPDESPVLGTKRKMSAAGRKRIAAAQRARWARVEAGKGKKQSRRKMSPAVRAKMRAAAKARWAKVKASGNNSLAGEKTT